MRQELAAIREHLRRLGEQLAQPGSPSEPEPPLD
jgi:hypothetical protein